MLGARGESRRSRISARPTPTMAADDAVAQHGPGDVEHAALVAVLGGVDERDHEGDGHRVVEARLALQHGRDPGRLAAACVQHREHGRGVGRRERRADDQRERPVEPGHPVRRDRDQQERRERAGDAQRQHRRELAPQRHDAGPQASVDEDQHQRDRPHRLEVAGVHLVTRGRRERSERKPDAEEDERHGDVEPARRRLERQRGEQDQRGGREEGREGHRAARYRPGR